MRIPGFRRRVSRVYGHLSEKTTKAVGRLGLRKYLRLPRIPLKTLIKYGALALLACFVFGSGLVLWISRDLPDPNNLTNRQIAQSTKIYDRTGEHLLYEVFQDKKRTLVTLDQISPLAVKATIAVEDKHFYEHRGVRPISILRASFNNLIGRRAGSGGASTLTQQLIKNAIVGDESRGLAGLFRKIKEAIIALQVERKYTKDEIIQWYLNEIPYGSTNYGIETASQAYFHKSAKDLTLAEAATMAAIPKAPSRYLTNRDALVERRNLVLFLMHEQGFITEDEKKAAQGEALRMYTNKGIFNAPHFVDYVKEQLYDQYGERTVDSGGLKVITTLDFDKQQKAEAAVKELGDKFSKESNANNAALVAVDPKTAQILAMVGSRDYYNDEIDGVFNVAVKAKQRQPGSSFKPFVYLAAFEKGYTPETILYDVKTDFDLREGAKYTPKNYDNKEHGLLTMRSALQNSLNIPAVKAMYLVGEKNVLNFAKRFGYTTFTGTAGLTLVLGGDGVNLLEHTNAYATLANNGVYNPPVSILKITDPSGETVYEWKPTDGTEAVKPELAALISSVLSDDEARAMVFGRNSNITLPGRQVAGKTGTTNDSKDAWTMGYVPSLSVGVWVGNTIPTPMKGGGNLLAGRIWNRFMKEALASTTPENFPEPPVNDATKPVLRGSNGGIKLPIDMNTGKIAVSTTPPNLIVEKTYLPPHDILHYVIKDDPRGANPENPMDDPQYESWERGLQDWIARENAAGRPVVLEDPPTEYDSMGSPELAPTIVVNAPAANSVITSRDVVFSINAAAPRGVSMVTYAIDGKIVATANSYPFGGSYYARGLTNGAHTLRVLASDDQGNSSMVEVPFMFDAPLEPASVDWSEGSSISLVSADFPRALELSPYRWDAIKTVQIFFKNSDTEKLIYTFDHTDKLVHDRLQFVWKTNPGPGYYSMRALLTDSSGRTEEKILEIEIR